MSIAKRLDELQSRVDAAPTSEQRSIDLDRLSLDELRELRALIVKAAGEEHRDWSLCTVDELQRAEFLIDKATVEVAL